MALNDLILKELQTWSLAEHPPFADVETLALRLSDYLLLLHKWNQTYNLTAIRDLDDMIGLHVLDSLAILPWIKGPDVIDVGSGAGLPGIPLALANPALNVVLLDSNGKKTRFLQEVKRQLNLVNVEVVQSRVEDYQPTQGFDTVVTRAFSSIQEMLTGTEHLVNPDGIRLAMKGVCKDSELAGITHPYQVIPYRAPRVVGARCCVIIKRDEL